MRPAKWYLDATQNVDFILAMGMNSHYLLLQVYESLLPS